LKCRGSVQPRRGSVVARSRACKPRLPRTARWALIGATALGLMLGTDNPGAIAAAADKYPDIGGAWAGVRGMGGRALNAASAAWDPTKPAGLQQQAPLTAEYQAVFEANLANRALGGQDYNPAVSCFPAGMPRVMIAYDPLEIIVTPDVTYIRSDHLAEIRRIYTDGRDWPQSITPTFAGYSIGSWVGDDHEGRYEALEVETRGTKGPRVLDLNGLPLHRDNQTIVKERIFLDQADRNLLHDEITLIDHAYTQPWTVTRDYRREVNPIWVENSCWDDNHDILLGRESYFLSADGYLMPTKRDQPGPDLRNFGSYQ
jgi:hypothetical protein